MILTKPGKRPLPTKPKPKKEDWIAQILLKIAVGIVGGGPKDPKKKMDADDWMLFFFLLGFTAVIGSIIGAILGSVWPWT